MLYSPVIECFEYCVALLVIIKSCLNPWSRVFRLPQEINCVIYWIFRFVNEIGLSLCVLSTALRFNFYYLIVVVHIRNYVLCNCSYLLSCFLQYCQSCSRNTMPSAKRTVDVDSNSTPLDQVPDTDMPLVYFSTPSPWNMLSSNSPSYIVPIKKN